MNSPSSNRNMHRLRAHSRHLTLAVYLSHLKRPTHLSHTRLPTHLSHPALPASLPLRQQGRSCCILNGYRWKLEFRFPGKKLLLKEISLELKKGEIIAISGESGQGKSTLLQILQKFYPYEGGAVWINDHEDMETIPIPAWRKMIGVVPQDIIVFSGTLLANICLDPEMENIEKVRDFCHFYGFDRFFDSLPGSYTTLLGEGGVALSGGQKQLLALARCLYASPQLILLDEPTSAMDAATEHFVITILQRLREQAGLLIISHKDSLTEIADRIYLLDKGTTYQLPRAASFSMAN